MGGMVYSEALVQVNSKRNVAVTFPVLSGAAKSVVMACLTYLSMATYSHPIITSG